MLVLLTGWSASRRGPERSTLWRSDVRAVAHGGDPSAGVLPSAFGVAVKDAHCSHAATGYTVAIGGRSFTLRCSATAGGAVQTVTLGLSAGHTYPVTIRPIEVRPGRGPRMGKAQRRTISIPSADSKVWQPLGS
jgi:hypothetical protein